MANAALAIFSGGAGTADLATSDCSTSMTWCLLPRRSGQADQVDGTRFHEALALVSLRTPMPRWMYWFEGARKKWHWM